MNLNPIQQRKTRKHETLDERLFRYARKLKNLTFPTLSVGTPEDEEWNRGSRDELHGLGFLKSTWERLRRRVIDEEAAREADLVCDPVQIKDSGIKYLREQQRTLVDLIRETENKRTRMWDFREAWKKQLEEAESTGPLGQERGVGSIQSTVRGARIELLEIEEMVSLLKFRLSVVETMLSQIAVLDYVMTWQEVFSGEIDDHYYEDVDKYMIRTFIIGKALHEHEQKRGELPSFEKVRHFTEEWAAQLSELREYEGGEIRSHNTIRGAISAAGCWVKSPRGSHKSNLEVTLRNCVEYYLKHQGSS